MLGRITNFIRQHETIFVSLFFALITVAITWRVLPNSGGISYNDAAFYWNHKDSLNEVASTYSANYLGQNQASALFNYIPRALTIQLLDFLRFDDFTISYLVNFGVIFAAGVVYYFLFKNISRSRLFGLLSGVFVTLNNLTLEHFWVGGTQYFFLALIGFAFVFRECWQIHLDRRITLKSSLVLSIASFLLVLPFYVSMLLIFLFFFAIYLFFLIKEERRRVLIYGAITIAAIFCLHSYWIIPFLYNTFHISAESIFGGNLEGLYQGFVDIAGYTNAINFFHYFNFFSRNLHQTPIHYLYYFAIVAGIAGTLIYTKKRKNASFLIFLALLYVVFINLAVGPKSPLIGNSWELLWQKSSFLSFFRSFTRFLVIIVPIYILYYAVFVREVRSQTKNWLIIGIIGVTVLLNLVFFTGDIKGNITAIKIPHEYKEVANIVDANTENNILFLPNVQYEAYTWTLERGDTEPQSYLIKDFLFSKPALTNRASINLTNLRDPAIKDLFSFENKPNFVNYESYLRQFNVGYVLIQKDLVDISSTKRVDASHYLNYFRNSPAFEALADNDHLALYAFKKPTAVIGGMPLSFIKTSPTSYEIKLEGLTEGDLALRRRLDNNWSLRVAKEPIDCRIRVIYQEEKINECDPDPIGTLEYMGLIRTGTTIEPNINKQQSNAVNTWKLNAKKLKELLPANSYQDNGDGSINVRLTLYYYPQAVFYWSGALSIITAGLIVICLFFNRFLNVLLRARELKPVKESNK